MKNQMIYIYIAIHLHVVICILMPSDISISQCTTKIVLLFANDAPETLAMDSCCWTNIRVNHAWLNEIETWFNRTSTNFYFQIFFAGFSVCMILTSNFIGIISYCLLQNAISIFSAIIARNMNLFLVSSSQKLLSFVSSILHIICSHGTCSKQFSNEEN